jgi:Flp pilus assembly protein TadG
MIKAFGDQIIRFRKDERGVFLVIFALLALVLIATSGAVVDFSRVQQARTRAQGALDAAALALQGTINQTGVTAATLKVKAQALLTERIADTSVTAVVEAATPDTTAGKLTISGYISVPTYFTQLVGITSIRSSMLSEVTRSSSDLEVSVSLDVTGSMAATYNKWGVKTSDKIGDLIDATNTLIDLLVSTTQTPTYSKMAIVPWSTSANVGSTYAANVRGTPNSTTKTITAASWKSGSTKSISGITKANPAVITTSSNHGFSTGDTVYLDDIDGMDTWGDDLNGEAFVITKISNTKFSIPKNTSSWNSYDDDGDASKCLYAGCPMMITSNAHGYANGAAIHVSDASWLDDEGFYVANVTTNTLTLTGSFGPDEGTYASGAKIWCGDFGCSYRVFTNAEGDIRSYPVSTCTTDRTSSTYTDTAPSTTKLGFHYSSGGTCLTNTIQPLTSNKTTLHNLANSLVAAGSTSGHLGLAWGWYMISPNFAYLWPAASQPKAYGSANLIKAVVFMTDGVFNTPYCTGVVSNDALSGAGNDSSHINCASPHGSSKSQAEQLCTAIKTPANKTLLYVVGFDLAGDTDSLTMLQNCATTPEYFFQADDGTDLEDAFEAIAQSLSELRISK